MTNKRAWNFSDLTGQRFGRLSVSDTSGKSGRRTFWVCKCDCGVVLNVLSENLKSGNTQSCGCLHREITSKTKTTHGHTKGGGWSAEYVVWQAMRQRCNDASSIGYDLYGGRGIKVCQRWEEFSCFFEDMGPRPGRSYSIDRIDNSKGYFKENCRWATRTEQNNNTRRNVFIEHAGEVLTIAQTARKYGIRPGTLRARLHRGWSVDRSICPLPN